MQTVHARVQGRVQGVFFRDYTQRQAQKLDIKGWVKNMPDGSVETILQGDASQVKRMLEWLENGSPQSRVEHVAVSQMDDAESYASFEVRL